MKKFKFFKKPKIDEDILEQIIFTIEFWNTSLNPIKENELKWIKLALRRKGILK